MNAHSDSQDSEYSIRESLIGIGERSVRKSYYPQLQKQMEYLNDKSAALVNMLEDLEKARNELEDSEAKYRSIFENTGTASIIVDENGVISLANAEWISLSGYSKEENEGKSWTEYVAPEDLVRIEEWDRSRSMNESQPPRRYEFRFIRRDGEIRNVISSVTVIPGTNMRIASLIDITERKRAEEALHRLNRELHALSNCNQTLMRAKDEQALLNDVCRIVCDEAGYRMVWVGFAENDDARTIRPIARAGAENGYLEQAGLTWADTERGRGPSGAVIRSGESVCIQDFTTDLQAAPWRESALQRGYRSSIALPLKDDNANTFGVLNIYSTEPNAFTPDEMRLLEELAGDLAFGIMVLRTRIERQQAEERINHLAAIVESSDDAIIGKSLDGRIVSWNKGSERIYGYTAEEVLGKPISILVPADRQNELSYIMERLKRGEPVEHCELVRIRKDGQAIFVSLAMSPIMDADGRIVGASTIARDITEHKRTEEALRAHKEHLEELVKERTAELVLAKEAAEAANRAKSVFLASMSHELRTPLNAVLGFSQLMQADPTLNESQKENMEVINRSGTHLLGLINNVLEISRIEAGRVTKDETGFDLWNTLETIKDMMRVRAKAKGLPFILERDPSLPRYVKADEQKLKQVLINLAGNAVKFTQHGEIALRAKADNGGRILQFEVEDTGPGIDAKAISTLFESFAQGSHGQEGAGLGLFISRKLVEFMGGHIAVQSEMNKGSVFSFDIPCKSVMAAEIASPKTHRVASLAPGQRPPRILVAEDNPENRLLMTKTLRSKSFEVVEAVNGMEAVQLFEECQPDLVLMDMRMPVMDGYRAITRIRSTEQGKTAPIIAVTASAFEEDRQKILALGADDFIRKPVQDAELFEKIRLLLGIAYIYAEEQAQGTEAIAQTVLVELVAQLPKDLTDELASVMASLDLDGFKALLPKVRQHDPILAEQLGGLANGYQVTELAELFPTV